MYEKKPERKLLTEEEQEAKGTADEFLQSSGPEFCYKGDNKDTTIVGTIKGYLQTFAFELETSLEVCFPKLIYAFKNLMNAFNLPSNLILICRFLYFERMTEL